MEDDWGHPHIYALVHSHWWALAVITHCYRMMRGMDRVVKEYLHKLLFQGSLSQKEIYFIHLHYLDYFFMTFCAE